MTTFSDGGRHPLETGCPPEWASAWGHDQFGVFVEFRVSELDQRLRWIRPGTFLMGSPDDEPGRDNDEGPQHLVRITRGFWLADAPVTQALWQAITGDNPSHFQGDPRRPVEQVSWEDCQRFLAQLQERAPGSRFRLPTEAEWEYACRAGTTEATYATKLGLQLDDIVWCSANSEQRTQPIREKPPNPWGLHDMLGNVWEWCSDYYSSSSSSDAVADPTGPTTGGSRVMRGGSWINGAGFVRAAYRYAFDPDHRYSNLGLRLAREQGVR